MSISCSCDFYGGIRSVGGSREVTCRQSRECSSCEDPITVINAGDQMYIWSMYDFDEMLTSSPIYLCEECGDMALNLIHYGYCFDFNSSIRKQWLDHLWDTESNNPAVAVVGIEEISE